MAKSLGESTGYFKTAVFFLVVAVILHTIGFSTPSWMVLSFHGIIGSQTGLWQSCADFVGVVMCEETQFKGQGWFIAVQVIEAVGMAFVVIALIISFVLLFSVTSNGLSKVNINICSFAGSLIGIGLTIFAIKTMTGSSELEKMFGYSYWLSLGAMIALFVVVALLVCDKRQSSNS